ncbi:hypothetical protein VP01_929g6, partial [Puccinia sorghi]
MAMASAKRKGSSHTSKNIYNLCDPGGSYGGRLENIAKS